MAYGKKLLYNQMPSAYLMLHIAFSSSPTVSRGLTRGAVFFSFAPPFYSYIIHPCLYKCKVILLKTHFQSRQIYTRAYVQNDELCAAIFAAYGRRKWTATGGNEKSLTYGRVYNILDKKGEGKSCLIAKRKKEPP